MTPLSYFEQQYRDQQEREHADVLKLLNKAFGPGPRLLLAPTHIFIKSMTATKKRKPIAPKKPVLVRTGPSDRELSIMLGDACARGWISGTAALEAQRLVEQGRPMPADVRRAILGRGR